MEQDVSNPANSPAGAHIASPVRSVDTCFAAPLILSIPFLFNLAEWLRNADLDVRQQLEVRPSLFPDLVIPP